MKQSLRWHLAASVLAAPAAAFAQTADGDGDSWSRRVAQARATQPEWSSPLVTTTALLEQRARFDTAWQTVGNGTSTVNLGGGRGMDLILGESQEVQIAEDPFLTHDTPGGKGQYAGFADWPVLRFKQRLASSPAGAGDYVVSTWLQAQVPSGIPQLGNHAYTLLPTLGAGKGWGPVVVQATLGGVLPTAYQGRLGNQIVGNLALQYHAAGILWPQIEVNWTSYQGGPRSGLNQVFLTPGLVVGKLALTQTLKFTCGVGYQTALSPHFRASPLTPAYDHAWLTTARISF